MPLGLMPHQHSTGGKPRLGRITKAGNEQIRMLLVLGATSMVRRAERWNNAAGAWMRELLVRRPARLATVALANKMARVAPRQRLSALPPCGTDHFVMAVMARKEDYRPPERGAGAAPGCGITGVPARAHKRSGRGPG